MTAEELMRVALQEAKLALDEGEVAVGAAVEWRGKIIARAHNRCEQQCDATQHAEMLALAQAARVTGDWRLTECTLSVTLEPCVMCAGAIKNARVGRVVFGAADPAGGGFGGAADVRALGCAALVVGGVLEEECRALLRQSWEKARS